MSKLVFDIELFFIFLANSIVEFPSLKKDFEEYYKLDKYRFHERITRSSRYDEYNMSDKALDLEMATRRVYGILLCAEEDESNRDFVHGKLLGTNKVFARLIECPTRTLINTFIDDAIVEMKNMPDSYDAKNAHMYFLAYLFYSAYGTDSDNQVVNDYLSHTYKQVSEMNNRKIYYRNKIHKDLNLNGIAIPKKSQMLIKQLKTGFDLSSFIDFHNADIQDTESHLSNPELYAHLGDYCDSGEEESWDLRSATAIINMATHISNVIGFDLLGLNGSAGVTKDEQNMIIKMLADMRPGATAAELKKQISVTNYIIGHIFMLMAKETRNMKAFYFKNNSETQFFELQRLEAVVEEKDLEVVRLKTELTKAEDQNERQREEIKQLIDEVYKEDREALRPYKSELSELNGRIRDLEKALDAEQAKTPELYALREFAFAVQSDYIPSETTVTLAELICDKKIIVVGGHVNWRNKMKAQYPAVEFLDGHSVSINNAIFDKADITLLYTSNMSHKLYEKIMNHLRNRKLKFDYLGRSKNQELLEAEIISISQKNMSLS